MLNELTDQIARRVFRQYPSYLQPRTMNAVGNSGGYSGARLWRVSCELGEICLRAWPPSVTTGTLQLPHECMRLAGSAGLSFVPTLHAGTTGMTWLEHEGRLWEATSWQPGQADFAANPSKIRLQAACSALARLHESWKSWRAGQEPCPAVLRRIARAEEWLSLKATGWRPTWKVNELLRPLIERGLPLLEYHVPRIPILLRAWADGTFPLQPCLCDVWHDHVLFTGDTVTGIVDFGGTKIDHVSVDIARLLGSLVGSDREQWAVGLDAYRAVRRLSAEEEKLAPVLDQTGTIVGVVNWVLWICRDRREFEDWRGVAQRLSILLDRIERQI
jgi:Ser/Thr protein kinase RdoA (MazF antagonist)